MGCVFVGSVTSIHALLVSLPRIPIAEVHRYPQHVINFFYYLANELAIMARLGFRTINQMVGHAGPEKYTTASATARPRTLAPFLLLTPHTSCTLVSQPSSVKQDHKLYVSLFNKLISEAELTLDKGLPSRIECDIVNTDSAMGTSLSYRSSTTARRVCPSHRSCEHQGFCWSVFRCLPGPWCHSQAEGDANDYVGKGLSGGRVIVYPPARPSSRPRRTSSWATSACCCSCHPRLPVSSAVSLPAFRRAQIPVPRLLWRALAARLRVHGW